ncbi:ABC transporter substrate-binding protein [Streptomyces sp. NPDC093586]|uniref:ABC transporter substrate-binding protein n=1 Tax=Streptomyces sp. NPDC093586 TaxID=3366042 RepID=UPI0037F74932
MTESERAVARRTLLRTAAGITAGTAMVGALAGCSDDGDGSTGADGDGKGGSSGPKRGGRLRAAFIGGSNETADVIKAANTPIDYVRARVVYDELCVIGPDGGVQMQLAESIEPNTDGTEWTIRVRDGVRFSNGRKLGIDDVLYTLSTQIKQQANTAPLLVDVDIANARRKDSRTAVLPMKRPHGFLDLVFTQGVFVFPEGTKNFEKAPGSGPFLLENHRVGQGALLKRNPDYWSDKGPFLDELELLSIADGEARLNALKAGQVDYAASISLVAGRAERQNGQIQLLTPPKWEWPNFGAMLKRNQAPFKDARVVEALKYAVDREEMVKRVTLGFGEFGNDLFGKHLPYYAEDLPQREYDPERAKKLLKDAGAEDLSLTIRTSDYEYGLTEGAVVLADQVKKAGVKIKLDKVPAGDFFADPKVFIGAHFQSANRKPRPLPLDVLFFYGSEALLPFTGLAGGKIDSLVDRVRSAVTDEQRRSSLSDIQHYLYDEGGDMVWAKAPVLAAAMPKVHDVKSLGYPTFPSFRDAYLA